MENILRYRCVVETDGGLNVKHSARLVNDLSSFVGDFLLEYKGKVLDAKSILALITLGIEKGETLDILARVPKRVGADAIFEVLDKYFHIERVLGTNTDNLLEDDEFEFTFTRLEHDENQS
jgi:phosphotransferase system HPr (HPr) family protein